MAYGVASYRIGQCESVLLAGDARIWPSHIVAQPADVMMLNFHQEKVASDPVTKVDGRQYFAVELARAKPRFGYPRLHVLLKTGWESCELQKSLADIRRKTTLANLSA